MRIMSCTVPLRSTPSPPPRSLGCRRFCHYAVRASFTASGDPPGFILHDSLDAAGINTHHARAAREGFCDQIKRLTAISAESSIAVSRGANLAKIALYIAAEDDSLVSHSSVPLPVNSFVGRLNDLFSDFCTGHLPPSGASPEIFLGNLEHYLYVHKGFHRTENASDSRALYLHSTLTCKSGSVTMLSLIYSEILKMLKIGGYVDFDAEVYCPNNFETTLPRGYDTKKYELSDEPHILTSKSLIIKILTTLKYTFWPFQCNKSSSLFLRAVNAANRIYGDNIIGEIHSAPHENVSPLEIASAKANQHRLKRGIWTSVRYGDMHRALAACERLLLLRGRNEEMRDYAVLLYHCGYYQDCMKYLNLYQDSQESEGGIHGLEDEAVKILKFRVNLILAQDGWSDSKRRTSYWSSNYEPW